MKVLFLMFDSSGEPAVRSEVPGEFALNHLLQNLKLLEGPLKMRCEGELPGKAASCIFLSIGFHQIYFNCSFYLFQC